MQLSRLAYIAVRESIEDGQKWFDYSTVSGLRDVCEALADKWSTKLPVWAQSNPVARIARVTITENEE